jgi:hypothetical protein
MRGQNWMSWGRMTHAEYRANLNGLNIFFGAVLGVVMAGTDALAPLPFAMTLFLSATLVITILYVSSSPRRITYSLLAALFIAGLPHLLPLLTNGAPVPPHLQPTLAVWLAITVLAEFLPREKPSPREPGVEP